MPRDLSQEPQDGRRAGPTQSRDDAAELRRLARHGGWTLRERLLFVLYPIRYFMSDLHYASKRSIELRMGLPQDWRQSQGPGAS